MKIKRELKIGILFIAAIAVLIWGFNFLKGTDLFNKRCLLYAVYSNVDGLQNADPEFFSNTVKIEKMSYREAIEFSFYGAKILHPKTIKPLQNKNMPLRIKSFDNPQSDGSVIRKNITKKHLPPFIILKQNQVLISQILNESKLLTILKHY